MSWARLPLGAFFAVTVLMLAAGLGTVSLGSGAIPGGDDNRIVPTASGSTAPAAGSLPRVGAPTGSWGPGSNSSRCQANSAQFNSTYQEGGRPLDVRHTLQSPCYIGQDEPGLNFLSNATDSGSRVQYSTDLPPAGTYLASVMTNYWFGMWLAGIPCSYQGESYLELQINPPYSPNNPGANWTLQAPVWDLAPVGSCDPSCQNDTADFTIEGVTYCEDDAILSGPGTYTTTGWGNFQPGDNLTIDLVGAVGGSEGLEIWVNDTTHPAESMYWTYGASVTVSGLPLTPYYSTAGWENGGWGYGLDIEISWENCPHAPGPSICVSYNEPALNSIDVPTFPSVSFWNASSQSYSNSYSFVATTSSSGACSGLAAPCFNYNINGGTGFYPYWSLHAWDGASWWMYGGTYPHEVNDFGQAEGEFTAVGYIPVYHTPTSIYATSNVTSSSGVRVTAAVADPAGVSAVQVGAFWCFGSTSQTVSTTAAALSAGAENTTYDGNWTASVPTDGYIGTMHYWLQAESVGGVWSSPVPLSAVVSTGGSGSCAPQPPAAPTFASDDITPIGAGYALNWSDSSPGLWNYTIWFNDSADGATFSESVGPAHPVTVAVGVEDQAYSIALVAWNAAGLRSATTAWVQAPATLFNLSASLAPTSSLTDLWIDQASVTFDADVAGGLGPFIYTFAFQAGNTTNTTVSTSAESVGITHEFTSYYGAAVVSVTVTDAVGDSDEAGPVIVPIAAPPLGVPQWIAAGDSFVNISWAPPLSPASPVTFYSVYYTINDSQASTLTAAWPGGQFSPNGTYLVNTTGLYLRLPIPDGVTLYAVVLAWNEFGEGGYASGTETLNATPAELLAGPIACYPGGAAPFTDSFSTVVTGGTNVALTGALYSFPNGVTISPNISSVRSTFWINASYTFTSPGLQVVVLHAYDDFGDTAIQTVQVWVSPSTGPLPTIAAFTNLTGNRGWVNQIVVFTASVTTGEGSFSFLWQFGDGANSTGPEAEHAYAKPGTYTATIWVTSSAAPTQPVTESIPVSIYALPSVAISAVAGPTGALSVTLKAIYSGGFGGPSFEWSFGDNSPQGYGAVVNHTYAASGTYTVIVVAKDSSNKTTSDFVNINVGGPSSSTSPGGGVDLSGANGILIAGLAVLVVVLLIGLLYFWSRSRRPVVMAPEGALAVPEEEAPRPPFQE